jgi:dihydroorotate dehydrogenase
VLPAGLRSLQGRKQLQELVSFVKTARDNLDWGPSGPPPLLVKVAPDLTDADKVDIAAVILDTGVDGLVVSNTTISRPGGWGQQHSGMACRPVCRHWFVACHMPQTCLGCLRVDADMRAVCCAALCCSRGC